jgi:hypothetical protein
MVGFAASAGAAADRTRASAAADRNRMLFTVVLLEV